MFRTSRVEPLLSEHECATDKSVLPRPASHTQEAFHGKEEPLGFIRCYPRSPVRIRVSQLPKRQEAPCHASLVALAGALRSMTQRDHHSR